MKDRLYTIKIGKLYLYDISNMFTPRIDKCRAYAKISSAKKWIEDSHNKNGISESGIRKEDFEIVKVVYDDEQDLMIEESWKSGLVDGYYD